ncbi:hypothetical protein GGR57DRAFT_507284 [Xylariaceae sp. FL1272]|nr:hypothetical protein GGR57DRAFT_507284 [Xylariaceae sp. FL1272]
MAAASTSSAFEKWMNRLNQTDKGFEWDKRLANCCVEAAVLEELFTKIPTGAEKGFALAIDIDGFNLRITSVHLLGDSKLKTSPPQVHRSADMKAALKACQVDDLSAVRTADEFWALVARQLKAFLEINHASELAELAKSPKDYFPLGLTWSSPTAQTSLNSAILEGWTKDLGIGDFEVGEDVCWSLQSEIHMLKIPVKITAFVNHVVAAITARTYRTPSEQKWPCIGGVFGNEVAEVLEVDVHASTKKMYIRSQFTSPGGVFKNLPCTNWDKRLMGPNGHEDCQAFEKRVSGMFLGELLRLAVKQATREQLLFTSPAIAGKADEPLASDIPLSQPYSVDSSLLALTQAAPIAEVPKLCDEMCKTFGLREGMVSEQDANSIKTLIEAIVKRAGRLAGTALAAVIAQSQSLGAGRSLTNEVEVVVAGGLVEDFPQMESDMRSALRDIDQIGEAGDKLVRLVDVKAYDYCDGAAIVAHLAAEANPTWLIRPRF